MKIILLLLSLFVAMPAWAGDMRDDLREQAKELYAAREMALAKGGCAWPLAAIEANVSRMRESLREIANGLWANDARYKDAPLDIVLHGIGVIVQRELIDAMLSGGEIRHDVSAGEALDEMRSICEGAKESGGSCMEAADRLARGVEDGEKAAVALAKALGVSEERARMLADAAYGDFLSSFAKFVVGMTVIVEKNSGGIR